jgi:hypothetical protein
MLRVFFPVMHIEGAPVTGRTSIRFIDAFTGRLLGAVGPVRVFNPRSFGSTCRGLYRGISINRMAIATCASIRTATPVRILLIVALNGLLFQIIAFAAVEKIIMITQCGFLLNSTAHCDVKAHEFVATRESVL